MLNVVYSNQTQQLAVKLAEAIQAQPLPPFERETLIVQSNELSRWLSLYLANNQGIAANLDFPFPSAWIWSVFRQLWPDTPLQSPYDKSPLTWRIYTELKQCVLEPDFEPLARYLSDPQDDLKRFELAAKLADSFDQYLIYRPDWVDKWQQGDTHSWQAKLWYRLTKNDDELEHRANLLERLIHLLQQSDTVPVGLPQRISVFGLSALPPVYMDIFQQLARFIDVTLYFLSPSPHYWGDLVDSKRQQIELFEENDEASHPLVANLGKQGQEFFRQLQGIEHQSENCFIAPQVDSMLAQLQHDMFDLEAVTPSTVNAKDNSIAFHNCHSPMREMEILHDQLLAMLEADSELNPTDIVVMTPDISQYAPWIEAVFATVKTEHSIPYSIADSQGQQQSPVVEGLMQLLALPQSRFDVESVLKLLDIPAVQQRFSIDEMDLHWIRQWCRDTTIRWGIDGEDKQRFNLPTTDANTWRAGLDRLLLGYAMPLNEVGKDWQLFDGQLAFDGISGDKAQLVALLCSYLDMLIEWRKRLSNAYNVLDWQSLLNQCLDCFFRTDGLSERQQIEAEITAIRQQLDQLSSSAELAKFDEKVSIDIVANWLQSHLQTLDKSHHFMGHGVTFCGMVPMRSIPFEVICLVGLNDDTFPRRQPNLSFDLLTTYPREGDRSRRDDDRYLFLEALLSAQRYLYLSYVGTSITDNAERPPSVLVSDLQDLIAQRFGDGALSQSITHHPLQPFSQRYFNGQHQKLFSFNSAKCPIPLDNEVSANWFDAPLPEADESFRDITREQLISFYNHPARYLCKQRLNIYLEQDEDQLENREPFSLDGLDSWKLRQQLLENSLKGKQLSQISPLIQATGTLPQGNISEAVLQKQQEEVDTFVEKLSPYLPTQAQTNLPFDLHIDAFRLTGQLSKVSPQGLLLYRFTKTKGKYLIEAWIEHLILNILQPEKIELTTRIVLQDKQILLLPVAEPTAILAEILALYWQGCHQPLPLFDKSSFSYAKQAFNTKKTDPEKGLKDAKTAWNGSDQSPGEKDDQYYQWLYQTLPLDDEFIQLAERIYQPLFEHIGEESK